MLTNDAAEKQKTVTARERQARELAARGQREAAIQVVQQKQEAQVGLQEIEGRLDEARRNSEEMQRSFREQERRYNDLARERAALMEEHQRSKALRAANEARASISLTDSSRDLEKARQAIRQSSYEAQAVGELGSSETERQIAAVEMDVKRLDAERELEMMELQMGLRSSASLEPGEEPVRETEDQNVERLDERRVDRGEGGS
jgi:phage shock protein A